MNFRKLLFIIGFAGAMQVSAQIGYQVAVIDQSTGEPKANKTVTVKIELSDNSGSIFCKSTQSAETNEFGVVSLQIGDTNTFSEVDWTKLPLWVNATVDGVNVGKTQILNVPVAEYAKQTGVLTKDILVGKWNVQDEDENEYMIFDINGSFTYVFVGEDYVSQKHGVYYIDGDFIAVLYNNRGGMLLKFVPQIGAIFVGYSLYIK